MTKDILITSILLLLLLLASCCCLTYKDFHLDTNLALGKKANQSSLSSAYKANIESREVDGRRRRHQYSCTKTKGQLSMLEFFSHLYKSCLQPSDIHITNFLIGYSPDPILTCKTSHQRWSAFFPSKMWPQYGYITLLPTLNIHELGVFHGKGAIFPMQLYIERIFPMQLYIERSGWYCSRAVQPIRVGVRSKQFKISTILGRTLLIWKGA